jgi:murein DD-endopeptidase MepM/ murein hydrolase activator NlpD
MEGELEENETDRWIFGAAAGQLATVEIWFRPASTSGPEAQMNALLIGPEGVLISQETGTVTLPPYVVEQELPDTGSYLIRLDSLSGTPGRYTVLVTISNERLLTRPDVYTSTLPLLAISPQEGTEVNGSWGFVWPAPRRAISGWYFHDQENPGHAGLDIAAAMYDPLYAAAAGTVSFAGSSGGYGNLVVIDHSDGWQSWYGHLSLLYVTAGQEVSQGEPIGAAGSTGFSSGPHLHFELRHEGIPMDPLVYLQ